MTYAVRTLLMKCNYSVLIIVVAGDRVSLVVYVRRGCVSQCGSARRTMGNVRLWSDISNGALNEHANLGAILRRTRKNSQRLPKAATRRASDTTKKAEKYERSISTSLYISSHANAQWVLHYISITPVIYDN